MLAAWDDGKMIWSLAMGGLGPGYEQAIQTMAVEFTRAALAEQFKLLGDGSEEQQEADYERLRELCSKTLGKFDAAIGGATGAMFSAAVWLTWRWIAAGPRALVDTAYERGDPDRVIQVNNLMKIKVS
jgi:hypothetical protein